MNKGQQEHHGIGSFEHNDVMEAAGKENYKSEGEDRVQNRHRGQCR